MATTNLGITELLESQSNKVVTVNDALEALDLASNAVNTVTVGATADTAGITLTQAQLAAGVVHRLVSSSADGNFNLRLPAVSRLFVVDNQSGFDATVYVDPAADGADGTTVVVADGEVKLLLSDGTDVVEVTSSGGGGGASATLTENAQTGTTYTLVLADAPDVVVSLSNAAAITLTVPENATVAIPVGSYITIWQKGAGQVEVVGAGAATIELPAGASAFLRAENSFATLYKSATDTWQLFGDLEATGILIDAANVSNTPAGGIAATDVQAALNELDTDKVAVAGHAAVSVIGRSANTSGAAADIAAASNDTFFGRISNALGFFGLTGALVANTPAGGIAATTVQAALNELDTEKYDKTGGALTGAISITSASVFNQVNMESSVNGVGPFFQMYHNDASPSSLDFLAGFVSSGNSSTGVKRTMGEFYFRIDDPTNGAERAHLRFGVISAGVLATQMYLRNGVVIGSDSDISQGRGTIVTTGAWFVHNGSPIQVVTANGLLRKRVFTVATLPASGIANGDCAIVTDATATTMGSIVAGGGANRVPVNYDGTNWRIG